MVALQTSCNYFFYELGDRISLDAMDSTAKAMGLGEVTGVELAEKLGHRANAETKALLYSGSDATWFRGDQILAAIGQSENLFSPMQMAVYASTLANRGTRYSATFLNRVVSSDYRTLVLQNYPKILSTLNISDDAFYAYRTGMYMAAHQRGGTAYSIFKNYPVKVCCKTGTAQHGGGTKASDHGSFICFAPMDDPQIAIAIYGEKISSGGALSTVARSILDVYFDVDTIGDVITNENQIG
jgi:penicillin-binding protein 2